jgi:hypothetical protein
MIRHPHTERVAARLAERRGDDYLALSPADQDVADEAYLCGAWCAALGAAEEAARLVESDPG